MSYVEGVAGRGVCLLPRFPVVSLLPKDAAAEAKASTSLPPPPPAPLRQRVPTPPPPVNPREKDSGKSCTSSQSVVDSKPLGNAPAKEDWKSSDVDGSSNAVVARNVDATQSAETMTAEQQRAIRRNHRFNEHQKMWKEAGGVHV